MIKQETCIWSAVLIIELSFLIIVLNVSLVLICKSHWIKASAKWVKLNVKWLLLDYFYSFRFDFCADQAEKRPSENLGQVLFGERIEPSPYKVYYTMFL